jgi:hypothetical protein
VPRRRRSPMHFGQRRNDGFGIPRGRTNPVTRRTAAPIKFGRADQMTTATLAGAALQR